MINSLNACKEATTAVTGIYLNGYDSAMIEEAGMFL